MGLPAGAFVVVPAAGQDVWRLSRESSPTVSDFEERVTRAEAERLGLPEIFRNECQPLRATLASGRTIALQTRVRRSPAPDGGPAHPCRAHPVEQPGHVDVWGFPHTLLAAILDVERFA